MSERVLVLSTVGSLEDAERIGHPPYLAWLDDGVR